MNSCLNENEWKTHLHKWKSTIIPFHSCLMSLQCILNSTISGNFFSFEQPLRLKNSRASKLILWGRLLRHLQPFKSNRISLLRSPRDACILYSLVQRWRINCLRFGAPLRSGISIKFWESLRSMSFNSFKIYYKTRNIRQTQALMKK